MIFYDGASAAFWQDTEFVLAGKTDLILYLLYRREDFFAERQAVSKSYTDTEGMRDCYRLLRSALNQGCQTVADLVGLKTSDDVALTEEILQIFKELNFVQIENGLVSVKSQNFNPLMNSPTYSKMLETYGEKIKELNRALEITPAEIANMWK